MNGAGNIQSNVGSESDASKRAELQARHVRYWLRFVELVVWTIVGGVILPYRWIETVFAGKTPTMPESLSALAGLFVLGFPVLFQLIFQSLPLQAARTAWSSRLKPFQTVAVDEEMSKLLNTDAADVKPSSMMIFALLTKLANSSSRIAEKIYTRAGVYLLIGVLIAFSGLAFFYTQNALNPVKNAESITGNEAGNKAKEHNLPEQWTELAPQMVSRFGILFFIELVAFFFLRQYRAAMDEYRYFEAIKRRREENLILATIFFKSSGDQIDFFKFVEKCSFYSDAPKLASGETTEILESRKLTKDETVLFEKMIDAVTQSKKSSE